jgi:hypothetical protein
MIGPITRYDGAVTERAGGGLMAGPEDRALEQQQGPDSVRTRESDPVGADLRQRLERLPPGHPSSPYNDDGSRKPPVPDPFEHDYPIPGDPDYEPGTPTILKADRPKHELSEHADDLPYTVDAGAADEGSTADVDSSLDAEEIPRVAPDGSWEWKGYPLTAEQSRFAAKRVERCREAEGRDMNDHYGQRGITPAMHRVEAQLEQGELVPGTEKFALKTVDRFKEKLAKMILEEPDADWRELVPRITDGIRYTFLFPDEGYTSAVMETCDSLTSVGFELYEQKNAWADETKAYKGINSAWMDRDTGVLFEVQMHTSASWAAKQESHREYEIIQSRSTTADEKTRSCQRQDQIFAKVSTPDGAAKIPNYRKEGW